MFFARPSDHWRRQEPPLALGQREVDVWQHDHAAAFERAHRGFLHAGCQVRLPAFEVEGEDFRHGADSPRGSVDDPIRNSSTARAAWRPSRIAHTTSDWPRRMSPAANTLGTDVR